MPALPLPSFNTVLIFIVIALYSILMMSWGVSIKEAKDEKAYPVVGFYIFLAASLVSVASSFVRWIVTLH